MKDIPRNTYHEKNTAMQDRNTILKELNHLFTAAVNEDLREEAYAPLCRKLGISRVSYDMNLGEKGRYRDHKSGNLVMVDREQDGRIILFDDGRERGISLIFPYYYDNIEYVHSYVDLAKGITGNDIDQELIRFLSDVVYILVSRSNMRHMLDFAEITDAQTGIPNIMFIQKKYQEITGRISPSDISVVRVNLRNFKYINEVCGSKCGDEAIIAYSRMLVPLMDDDECVCRMGGDNFAFFVKRDNLDSFLKKIECISVSDLSSAPSQSFDITAWMGISETVEKGRENIPFMARLNDASIACDFAKNILKKSTAVFSSEMSEMINRGRDIVAAFYPAIRSGEFGPFYQAKVDMRTGELVGFEALCRWIHHGQIIYPDQFIPILDKEGMIPQLDLAIFSLTCENIRRWKDMGYNPPRVSANFSRRNLFVPEIEEKILSIISEKGLDTCDVEVEITESLQETEYDRLVSFVKKLKKHDVHIAVDDFGTGYSSMSLLHNIDVDVIKIDKSFVDLIPFDQKSMILLESIVNIADRLGVSTVAEGVEKAEQGVALMKMGCNIAQGFYYSRPVNFEDATKLIASPSFTPIGS